MISGSLVNDLGAGLGTDMKSIQYTRLHQGSGRREAPFRWDIFDIGASYFPISIGIWTGPREHWNSWRKMCSVVVVSGPPEGTLDLIDKHIIWFTSTTSLAYYLIPITSIGVFFQGSLSFHKFTQIYIFLQETSLLFSTVDRNLWSQVRLMTKLGILIMRNFY